MSTRVQCNSKGLLSYGRARYETPSVQVDATTTQRRQNRRRPHIFKLLSSSSSIRNQPTQWKTWCPRPSLPHQWCDKASSFVQHSWLQRVFLRFFKQDNLGNWYAYCQKTPTSNVSTTQRRGQNKDLRTIRQRNCSPVSYAWQAKYASYMVPNLIKRPIQWRNNEPRFGCCSRHRLWMHTSTVNHCKRCTIKLCS